MMVVRSHAERGILQTEPQDSFQSLQQQRETCSKWNPDFYQRMALWSFPRASQAIWKSNFPVAVTAALQTLQGTLENVNP